MNDKAERMAERLADAAPAHGNPDILTRDAAKPAWGAPSFSLGNRVRRAAWSLAWLLLARWTPSPLHGWRRLLLRLFGARLGRGVVVYGSATIWDPRNLEMAEKASLGPRVICYNMAKITLGAYAVASQGAHLCAGSHRTDDPNFQLISKPIAIGARAWIAADAFVGPGVTIGEGAVLGARGVATRDVPAWTIWAGNPARQIRTRPVLTGQGA